MRLPSCSAVSFLAVSLIGLSATAALAQDAPRPAVRSFTCPVDGTQTQPVGSDGKQAAKLYSDLEEPTRAYTNLVAACSKCGYSAWTQDFERGVSSETTSFVRSRLAATARRAGSDPIFAYQHHLQLLDHRNAGKRERIGAWLFYSYVLKRRRPAGGQDAEGERQIQQVRKTVMGLLADAMRDEPPRSPRARLEWQYLLGELARLAGNAKQGAPLLRTVCDQREEAGFTVGKLACEMADRAAKGETFEDYRDGVFDVSVLPPPGAKPAPAAPTPAPAPPVAAPPPPTPAAPLPPMTRQPPPREQDPTQPPAPPTATGM